MGDLDKAIAQLRSCRPIPESQVREVCYKARELLIEEGNVVTVNAPVTVCFLFLALSFPFLIFPLSRPLPCLSALMLSRYAATSTASSTT